jgi:hypothetical protein
LSFLFELGNFKDFYGPNALLSLETIRTQFPTFHLNIFHFFGVELNTLYFFAVIWGIGLLFSTIGLYTRYSIIAVLICMVSFHQRNIWLLSSSEVLMRIITLYLACSPCGNSLSIDSLIAKRFVIFKKPSQWSPWAMKMIQLQTSVVYVWTVWHKLKGEDWFDGTALYYATRLEAMKNISIPFLMDSMFFIKSLTWSTLIIELALGIFLWFKETRLIVMILGILFHLGIEFTMSIPFFEIIMICLILSFLPSEKIREKVDQLKKLWLNSVQNSALPEKSKAMLAWIAHD